MVCKDHEETGLGKEIAREVTKLEREMRTMLNATGSREREAAVAGFRQKVERGDFAALFAGRMQELFDQQQGDEVFQDEIGALRVAMMRLLLEESDPVKLAMALSKVTNASVRAVRAQEEMEGAGKSKAMLERSVKKVEAAIREMTEEELWEAEVRAWKREVGWTSEQLAAWKSPENQRKLLALGTAEAVERMRRRDGGTESGLDGDPFDPVAFVESQEVAPAAALPVGRVESETGRDETAVEEDGETASEEEGKPVKYDNELERLFWEVDDPGAYHEYVRLAIEKEGGKGPPH